MHDIINSSTLVYRFSETHCNDCIEEQFMTLKNIDYRKPENVILLSSFSSIKKIRILKDTYELKYDLYNLRGINIPSDSLSKPYFFVIDPDLTCHSFFVPISELPLLTRQYLSTVKQKINTK